MILPSSPKPQPHQLSGTDETFQAWPVFSFCECLPLPHPPFPPVRSGVTSRYFRSLRRCYFLYATGQNWY